VSALDFELTDNTLAVEFAEADALEAVVGDAVTLECDLTTVGALELTCGDAEGLSYELPAAEGLETELTIGGSPSGPVGPQFSYFPGGW
jgi:hypothetical protein